MWIILAPRRLLRPAFLLLPDGAFSFILLPSIEFCWILLLVESFIFVLLMYYLVYLLYEFD